MFCAGLLLSIADLLDFGLLTFQTLPAGLPVDSQSYSMLPATFPPFRKQGGTTPRLSTPIPHF